MRRKRRKAREGEERRGGKGSLPLVPSFLAMSSEAHFSFRSVHL